MTCRGEPVGMPLASWHVVEWPYVLLLRRKWDRSVWEFGLSHAVTYRRYSLRKGWRRAYEWHVIGGTDNPGGLRAEGWRES